MKTQLEPTSSIIDFLRRYNLWRRGDETLTMESPTEIGEVLDEACTRLESFDGVVDRAMEWWDMEDDEMRLRCGEMTAQEIRSIRAVLNQILWSKENVD